MVAKSRGTRTTAALSAGEMLISAIPIKSRNGRRMKHAPYLSSRNYWLPRFAVNCAKNAVSLDRVVSLWGQAVDSVSTRVSKCNAVLAQQV